jgi:hypothetical protein
VTRFATKQSEAPTEQPAVEISLQLAPYELGQRRGETVFDGGVERLQVVAYDLVQRALLGASPLVDESTGSS